MRLVCDSSSDIYERNDVDYRYVPLTIICGERIYKDTPDTDPQKMLQEIQQSSTVSSSSCPNVHDWLQTFSGAEEIFCVTVTGGLSGSYSSALQAKDIFLAEHPQSKIHVIDSKGTGPMLALISDRIVMDINKGMNFEEIKKDITEYQQHIKLIFSLHSLENLARNGRINPLLAKGIGFLNIRIIAEANEEGKIKPIKQCRSQKKEIALLVQQIKQHHYCGGKIVVHHAYNPEISEILAELSNAFPTASIDCREEKCLDIYYADRNSILIGFEKE